MIELIITTGNLGVYKMLKSSSELGIIIFVFLCFIQFKSTQSANLHILLIIFFFHSLFYFFFLLTHLLKTSCFIEFNKYTYKDVDINQFAVSVTNISPKLFIAFYNSIYYFLQSKRFKFICCHIYHSSKLSSFLSKLTHNYLQSVYCVRQDLRYLTYYKNLNIKVSLLFYL